MTTPTRHRTGARRAAVAIVGVGAVAASSFLTSTSADAAAAANTLTVNAASTLRSVTHVASGSLYGLADASNPSFVLAQTIKPSEFVLKPSGGTQQATGDILVTAAQSKAVGAKVVDRLSDYYPGWPYAFSWSTWDSVVTNELSKVNTTTVPNLAAYAPWNEPDNTWQSSNGTFEDFWTHTYDLIRSKDATTPIQGPSFSDNISDMDNFLKNAVATNTVPDILAWHELENQSKIQSDIATVQALETKYGISSRPIDIEEYAAPSEVGIPGDLVGYIAKFERYGVRNAELAFWNGSGTLGDLLTGTGGSPNGAYWLYAWYAQMSGNMLTTTPYSSTSIDGAASLSSDGQQLSVIFGGGTSGSSAVQINGIPSSLSSGGSVHVTVEQTASTGRTTASSGPTKIAESNYTVSNGSINVPVTTTSTNAYRIVLTPTATASLAGSYQIVNVGSKLALATQNAGTSAGTTAVQSTSSTSSNQTWNLTAQGDGQYKIVNAGSGLVLGVSGMSTAWGTNALVWSDSGTVDHLWRIVSGSTSGQYKIVNVLSGLVLGVTGASTSSGATVLQWGDTGTSDHLWTLTKR